MSRRLEGILQTAHVLPHAVVQMFSEAYFLCPMCPIYFRMESGLNGHLILDHWLDPASIKKVSIR